eukprot:GEMP01013086.1.p1 GENE.GEMP01013086.1~~GEMP01013086.1.p1  ORF type:complete len:901 (+),score=156.68 GEMP01013086.1:87-2789(+)
MALYGQYFPATQLDRTDELVEEQIRQTQKKKLYHEQYQNDLLQRKKSQKLLVLANRLPITLKKEEGGGWTAVRSSGGLVRGLSAVKSFDMIWLGWPGIDVQEEDKADVLALCQENGCYPVWLSQDTINLYYNGFSNNVIWPLFHYIMPPLPDHGVNETTAEQWEAYTFANQRFVEAVMEVYEEDDYVWVHDYHLMLVPRLLRERVKGRAHIGWFLHTPWPSAEIYRVLSVREELIMGLLSADLLAFHVYDYARHFLSSCVQLTSLETTPQGVDATSLGGSFVKCQTCPIGIEPSQFTEALTKPEVLDQITILREQFGDRKVILGIDRLDYMKGIPHKLRAFDLFLEEHLEDWGTQVVLVQLAVPSRGDVPEYQRLKRQVHELVGQICGKHSTLAAGPPVIYLDQSLDHDQLVALYRVADVALITSLRDGMNLVSYEYVACQKDKHGVLILSEFAGAAQSLGAGSIRVNPWNVQETANAIFEAVTMGEDERQSRHEYAFNYVCTHTAQRWAETFIQSLKEACAESEEMTAAVPPALPYDHLLSDWSDSSKRLVLIDLLDCLVPAKTKRGVPFKLYQSLIVLPDNLLKSLEILAKDPNTEVIITASESRGVLSRVLGHLPLILAPEDGCLYRTKDGEWKTSCAPEDTLAQNEDEEWLIGVVEVFEYFQERTPGSYTDRQEYSLKWYYDNTQADFGSAQARELLIHLWAGPLVNSEAEVVLGSRSVTVRPHACSRAQRVETILTTELPNVLDRVDFALCISSVPFRDEDVYQTIDELICKRGDSAPDSPFPFEQREEVSTVGTPSFGSDSDEWPKPEPGELPPPYEFDPIVQRSDVEGPRPAVSYSISMGVKVSKAKYFLPKPYHVLTLLSAMAARLPGGSSSPGVPEKNLLSSRAVEPQAGQ